MAGKWLTDKELQKVAGLLLKERDEKKILSYLRLLAQKEYPLDISNLLALLKTENKPIKHLTLRLLAKVKDKRLRELIDKNYTDLDYLYDNLELFVSNYVENDMAVLSHILDTLKQEDEIHSFGMIIRDIFDENVIKHPEKLLYKLYALTNCSTCRKSFIKILMSANQVTDKLLRELGYDCETDIRQLARNYQDKANRKNYGL